MRNIPQLIIKISVFEFEMLMNDSYVNINFAELDLQDFTKIMNNHY